MDESEAARVDRLVDEAVAKARQLGVDKLVLDVYFNGYFRARDAVAYGFEEVLEADSKFSFKPAGRHLTFLKRDVPVSVHGDAYSSMELLEDSRRVFGLTTTFESHHTGEFYSVASIDAFIEGAWIEVIKRIKEMQEARRKKLKDDPNRIADLKQRFGID